MSCRRTICDPKLALIADMMVSKWMIQVYVHLLGLIFLSWIEKAVSRLSHEFSMGVSLFVC